MATYLTASLSESLHVSLSAQQQGQKNVKKGSKLADRFEPIPRESLGTKVSKQDGSISLCRQCMLGMAFIGVEMSAAFTVTYSVLFLQFLGVPTSLVSMQGVISGGSAFVLLPLIGWFSDRGSNPVTRKIGMMAVGYIAYILGYVGLVFCSVWKLYPSNVTSVDVIPRTRTMEGFVTPSPSSSSKPVAHSTISSHIHSNASAHLFSEYTSANNVTPPFNASIDYFNVNSEEEVAYFISVIGIFSFALLDIAFDSCVSLCRAFVLECTPSTVHSRLLVMATAFGAAASCLVGFIGTFDLPGALGPMFGVDGTPATMIMFSVVIFTTVTCTFTCTLLTGYRQMTGGKQEQESDRGENEYHQPKERNDMKGSYSYHKNSFKNSLNKNSWKRASTEEISHRTNSSEPLLSTNPKKQYHSTLGRSFEKQNSFDKTNQTNNMIVPNNLTKDKSNILHENEILDVTFQRKDKANNDKNNDVENSGESYVDSLSMTKSISDDERNFSQSGHADNEETGQSKIPRISSYLGTMINSYSFSVSIMQNNPTLKNDEESPSSTRNASDLTTVKPRSIWKNKRLMILSVSMFFTMGALLSFSQYSGNVVTLGIIHGNPLGKIGSEGRTLYDLGLRKAALGNLVCFLLYTTTSIFNKSIIDRIGESFHYILCQLAFMAAFIMLQVLQTEAMFFLTSAVSGVYRACSFTLGYILANKFVQEEYATAKGNSSAAAKNIGQVMVLIGMMLPASYLIESTLLGPLMSATGSFFVPVVYGIVTTALSFLVFCLLFVVKK